MSVRASVGWTLLVLAGALVVAHESAGITHLILALAGL